MLKKFTPHSDETYFIPLGGCGFFGANVSLYGHKGKWIMVDCGMGFADDTMPGIDILLPDLSFVETIKDNLLGLVVTHGHEDHIGAIEHLWQKFQCPIYTTAFTGSLIKRKLEEHSWGKQVEINTIESAGRFELGDFKIQFIEMAHSIPEMNAVSLSLEGLGTLLHTGDWKLDEKPVEGHLTDQNALKELGEKGLYAIMGDSTNAMVPGHSGSEGTVVENLTELFHEHKNRIVISCFSSNVARLKSIAIAAEANNRVVVLAGRSLWRIYEVAQENGYLKGIKPFLSPDDIGGIAKEKLVIVCTGSQGEPRAALVKVANGDHPKIKLEEKDVVIFSSRAIPGNERAINRVKNRLLGKGVEIVTDRDALIHVSGHPYREELKQILTWLKPKAVIPVHGEQMQLERHADLATEMGVSMVQIPQNGNVLKLEKDNIEIVGDVTVGMLALEGRRIVSITHEAILTRKRIMFHGSAVVTIVVDSRGDFVTEPQVSAMGLIDEDCEVEAAYIQGAIKAVKERLSSLPRAQRRNDEELSEFARIAARRYFKSQFDKKPQTRVHLVRI